MFKKLLLTSAALVLSACAGAPPDTSVADLNAALGTRAGGAVTPRVSAAERDAAAAQTAKLIAGPLSLDGALKLALLNAPKLQAHAAELSAAVAERGAATQITNPVLSAEVRHNFEPGAMAGLEFGLLTAVIDILTQPSRARVAASAYEAAKLQVAADIFEAAQELRTAYIALVTANNVQAVQAELTEAATASAELAERFHQAGNIPLVELRSQQSEAAEAELDLAEAELAATEARETLAALMGVDADAAWTVPEVLPAPPEGALTLPTPAVAERLDVRAARAAAQASLAELHQRTNWRLWQEAGLEVSGEREGDGEWSLGPKLELALPIFNQGRPEVQLAAAAAAKAEHERASIERAALAEVRQAQARLTHLQRRLARYRESVLPLTTEVVELKLKEYNYMFVGAFDVLLARREASEADLAYVKTVGEYWQARAELDAALGGGTDMAPVMAAGEPE